MRSTAAGRLVVSARLTGVRRMVAALAMLAPAAQAQDGTVTLGQFLGAFLADSGVATRGLSFSVANATNVRWETPAPVAANVAVRREGHTLERSGHAAVDIGEKKGVPIRVWLYGNNVGVQSTVVVVETTRNELTERMVLAALGAGGTTLTPLKCDLEKEGASFGNVAYVFRSPGKTASGLWAMWNCPHDGCSLMLTIVYRRAELSKVECAGG